MRMSKPIRRPAAIRRDIERLASRRAQLWKELSEGSEAERSQLVAINARIEELWLELRRANAVLRSGSRDQILARARRAERAERDLGRLVPS